jgi:hypothetical protein
MTDREITIEALKKIGIKYLDCMSYAGFDELCRINITDMQDEDNKGHRESMFNLTFDKSGKYIP